MIAASVLNYGALFAGAQNEVLGAVQAIGPLVVTILAVLYGIYVAVRIYRKFTNPDKDTYWDGYDE